MKSLALQVWVDDENEHQLRWFVESMQREFERRFKMVLEKGSQIHEIKMEDG